jgi:hypothetical protein
MSVAFFLAVGIAYAGGLAGQIGLLLLMIYMRRIARRDVSPGLGRLMTTLIWGFLAMAVLGVGMGASVVLATVALGPAMATTATAPTTMAVTGGTASAPAWAASLPTTGPVAAAPMPPVVFGSAFYFIMLASVMLELFGLAWLIAGIVALFWFRRVLGRAMEGRGAYHGEPDFAR